MMTNKKFGNAQTDCWGRPYLSSELIPSTMRPNQSRERPRADLGVLVAREKAIEQQINHERSPERLGKLLRLQGSILRRMVELASR